MTAWVTSYPSYSLLSEKINRLDYPFGRAPWALVIKAESFGKFLSKAKSSKMKPFADRGHPDPMYTIRKFATEIKIFWQNNCNILAKCRGAGIRLWRMLFYAGFQPSRE
jgi:hypothetical protein